jgi:hypothetical protein
MNWVNKKENSSFLIGFNFIKNEIFPTPSRLRTIILEEEDEVIQEHSV